MLNKEKIFHELDHQIADADWCDNDWKDNVPVWMLRGALALLKEQDKRIKLLEYQLEVITGNKIWRS